MTDVRFVGGIGWVWPPCADLIRCRIGWRLRTQRRGEPRRMAWWRWYPTKRLALAAGHRWVQREGRNA